MDIRYENRSVVREWEQLFPKFSSQLSQLYDQLASDSRYWPKSDKHYQLKGELATKTKGGKPLERWQHKISGAGRIWFLVDEDARTVWLEAAGEGHPSKTDK
ncbi:MAG: hypothetical protein QG596_1696 [Actinomycetota bacterium]|jgi:hypothetical protein|nr:hypothetical protein [Actinomycetota bacterium]